MQCEEVVQEGNNQHGARVLCWSLQKVEDSKEKKAKRKNPQFALLCKFKEQSFAFKVDSDKDLKDLDEEMPEKLEFLDKLHKPTTWKI